MSLAFAMVCFVAGAASTNDLLLVRADEKPYVEFDFSPLPRGGMVQYKFHFGIRTTDKEIGHSGPISVAGVGDPELTCQAFASFLENSEWKAKVVDKTKVRVYGYRLGDTLVPVTTGSVESKDLKPEELPKVTNPKNKG